MLVTFGMLGAVNCPCRITGGLLRNASACWIPLGPFRSVEVTGPDQLACGAGTWLTVVPCWVTDAHTHVCLGVKPAVSAGFVGDCSTVAEASA